MSTFRIFYSWQSDLDKKKNNFFIKDATEKAIKKLNRDDKVEFDISLDRDTKYVSGSPNIVETILNKIDICDIFICDLTIINKKIINKLFKNKFTPNPNVLIELGYAVKTLGWERVICIVNTAYCEIEDLPFDIKLNRISTYKLKNISNKKSIEDELVNLLKAAINQIINNYPQILENLSKNDKLMHDKNLVNKIDSICSQNNLFDSINFAVNNMSINTYHRNFQKNLIEFSRQFSNNFINKEIQSAFVELIKIIDNLDTFCAGHFFSNEPKYNQEILYYLNNKVPIPPGIKLSMEQSQYYSYPKEPRDDDWEKYNARFHKKQGELVDLVNNVEEAYKEYRLTVKKNLYI